MCSLAALLTSLFLVCKARGEAGAEDDNNSTVVQISSGPIRGAKMTSSWTNQTFYAFRGVPYAAPPIHDLRFKDPVPPTKWSGVVDCSSEQASCLQPVSMFSTNSSFEAKPLVGMNEDCLYLNVYTPQVEVITASLLPVLVCVHGCGFVSESGNYSSASPDWLLAEAELEATGSLLPVLVWVHGGGFVSGSGNYSSAGPDWLLAEGVVFVSMNYRLGAFGFLSLGESEAAGNVGLKDQRLALRWVQTEISCFGGDPRRVTLFGESAGAASVHLHYLSPLSVGLFHQVIGDSGTGLASWSVREDTTRRGLQLAEDLGCDVTSSSSALQCLRAADAALILAAQSKVKEGGGGISLNFVPTVDKISVEPFLPFMPETLLKQGQGSFVPFLMGTNRDEGVLGLAGGEETIGKVKNNLLQFVPESAKQGCSNEELKGIESRINELYFNGPISPYSDLRGVLDLYSDAFFSHSTAQCARHYRTRGLVYLYYFTFDGSFKEPIVLNQRRLKNISLVAHAEELNYLFVVKDVNQAVAEDCEETATRKRMVRMWTNFVKTGEPADGTDSLLQKVSWLAVDELSLRHLLIDADLTMNPRDYLAERIALWDSIISSSAAQPMKLYHMILIASLLVLFTLK